MKISTDRALQPSTSARDVLHRIAWSAEGVDRELSTVALDVLCELEAAEAEVERLKAEAADRAAVSAEQIALPILERPHLLDVGEADEAVLSSPAVVGEVWGIKIVADERVPDGVLRVVGGR